MDDGSMMEWYLRLLTPDTTSTKDDDDDDDERSKQKVVIDGSTHSARKETDRFSFRNFGGLPGSSCDELVRTVQLMLPGVLLYQAEHLS